MSDEDKKDVDRSMGDEEANSTDKSQDPWTHSPADQEKKTSSVKTPHSESDKSKTGGIFS